MPAAMTAAITLAGAVDLEVAFASPVVAKT